MNASDSFSGPTQGHPHKHGHDGHGHEHTHEQTHEHASTPFCSGGETFGGKVLTVRALSGLSGDMMLTGLARMTKASQGDLDTLLGAVGLPVLEGSVSLEPRSVREVGGWGCRVTLPHEHEHRSFADIARILEAGTMEPAALALSLSTFRLLAGAEGVVHGKEAAAVCFHEVGALDSLVDICLVCQLFVKLNPVAFVCSPLPLADGGVHCAHGWLPTPAPAVLELLQGVQVCSFPGRGETVTPTALALLKTLGAGFGPWPAMLVEERALVYGTRVFDGAPNGAIWAWGARA